MRNFFESLKDCSNLVGAEVGVLCGDNASNFLNFLDIKMVYLIDPWEPYINDDLDEVELKAKKGDKTYMDFCKNITYSRFCNDKRVVIMCKKSEEASLEISDSSLDFVYIDAKHSKKEVLNDCSIWYPKVKINGKLGGHDITHEYYGAGIRNAVTEFCNSLGNKKYYCGGDDWWIVK